MIKVSYSNLGWRGGWFESFSLISTFLSMQRRLSVSVGRTLLAAITNCGGRTQTPKRKTASASMLECSPLSKVTITKKSCKKEESV